MKNEHKWPFTVKMEEAARDHESVTMKVTAEVAPGVVFRPYMTDEISAMAAIRIVESPDPRGAQLMSMFNALDERGKLTTLALLATAVKLHPKVVA